MKKLCERPTRAFNIAVITCDRTDVARISAEELGLVNSHHKRRVAFTTLILIKETEGNHVSHERQWKKLNSEQLANQTLSMPIRGQEVGGRKLTAVFHQRKTYVRIMHLKVNNGFLKKIIIWHRENL